MRGEFIFMQHRREACNCPAHGFVLAAKNFFIDAGITRRHLVQQFYYGVCFTLRAISFFTIYNLPADMGGRACGEKQKFQ